MRKLLMMTVSLFIATNLVAMPAKALTNQEKLLSLINSYRSSKNLSPLTGNEALNSVTQAHSANMMDKSDLSHVLDGKSPSNRLSDAGITFAGMVENVAFNKGYQDPIQVCFEGWVNSPAHNTNMLNPDITDSGIGIVFSDSKGWWFTFMGIKPSGEQPQPNPESDKIQQVELTMRQGTSMNYTLSFRNTGQATLVVKASIPTGFGWLSIQPTTASIEPGKVFNFLAKIIVSAAMPVGKHTGRILFEHSNGSKAWDFLLSVVENPNLPRPNFEITCPKTASIAFESGAYAYISIIIKNTGNVDINPRATFASFPDDLVRMNPDSGFLTGKISKGAQFTAKIMMVMTKTTDFKTAVVILTLSDQGITKTCKIELTPAIPTSISIAGPQVVKLDFTGKTKTISYTATNTGTAKAILVPEVYYGANSCLVIGFESTGRGLYIDPGKSITVRMNLKLKCVPQVASIPGYIKISRIIGKEQTSKILEFRLVK